MHVLVCQRVTSVQISSSLPTTPHHTASLDATPPRRPHQRPDLPVPAGEWHSRMGGVEDNAIHLPISLLVQYPPLKRLCYPLVPILLPSISAMSFLFFFLIHCFFFVSGSLPPTRYTLLFSTFFSCFMYTHAVCVYSGGLCHILIFINLLFLDM